MPYATLADMQARFGERELVELTDTDNVPPAVVDTARVATKLEDASAFVDSYVGQRWALPLTGCAKPDPGAPGGSVLVPPPVLVRLTCDLARYYLYDDLAPESEVYRRYKGALRELEDIAAGTTQLSCPWGGAPGQPLGADTRSAGLTQASFSPRAITDETLQGFA